MTFKMKVVRNSHREFILCKLARAKLLNCQEISDDFVWLTLEMMKLEDLLAISQSFHESAKWAFYHFHFFCNRNAYPPYESRLD